MDWKGFKPISQIIKKKMTVNFYRKNRTLFFNAAASEKMKGYVNIGIDFERKAIAIEPTDRKEKYSIKLQKGKSCSRITRRELFDRLEELTGHLDGRYDMRWIENEKCFVIQFRGGRKWKMEK